MHMSNSRIFLFGGVVVVLVGLGTFYLAGQYVGSMAVNPRVSSYANTTYGYQFKYDQPYTVNEYTAERVDVGQANGTGGFDALAAVEIVESGEGGGYKDFNDFVIEKAKLLCDADGPDESLYCRNAIATETGVTNMGLSALRVDLELTYENRATKEVATSTFGSVYAVDIGSNVEDEAFAAVIIYKPLSTTIVSNVVERVLHTLQISRITQ